jgi:site-specific recombinase XerD
MLVTGQASAPVDYVVAARTNLGDSAAKHHAAFRSRFRDAALELGFTEDRAQRQWSALALVAAIAGQVPMRIDGATLERGRELLFTEAMRQDRAGYAWATSMSLFQVQATLFHLGQITEVPAKRSAARLPEIEAEWNVVPDELAETARHYVEQLKVSLRPQTIRQIEHTLRQFCQLVAKEAPGVTAARDIERRHVELYKTWLIDRISSRSGKPLTRNTVGKRLGLLANFFERITEWGWTDVPSRIPVFASDKPITDERLPRFIDDGAAAKLLIATRSDPDLFTRLSVEFLARTAMRVGELLDLTVDAVVQIGSSYWLRVPLGKLHNDRYIPLHPQLKALLDEWTAQRPETLRSPYMFIEQGRRIRRSRVAMALDKVAATAGIGHVTPHQLRHTLATQAINRGMSLEALAALLGHKTLSMTLVYARIADRTVADEYFAVSEKVEALYDQARALPADAEGSKMAQLRREMDRRMLGNGYCARPVELDCHFESICESCAFFVTTIEFKPTLERQRDDAKAKGQVGRQRIFDGLLQRLDRDAS